MSRNNDKISPKGLDYHLIPTNSDITSGLEKVGQYEGYEGPLKGPPYPEYVPLFLTH